jgi:hypothetical protein
VGKVLETKVELELVLGSRQDMVEQSKDTEGTVSVGSDRSTKAVVSIGQYHEGRRSHSLDRCSLLRMVVRSWWEHEEEEQPRQEGLDFSPVPEY